MSRWDFIVSVMGRTQGATLKLSDCYLKLQWLTQVGLCVAARSPCQHDAKPGLTYVRIPLYQTDGETQEEAVAIAVQYSRAGEGGGLVR